jgi:hypothetical protein
MENKWISVKDIMPNASEWVLCYGPELQLTDGYVVQSWWDHTNKDYSWFQKTFTHWMPLPEPPNYERHILF